jgi:undecaprenyl-diphosphatase
MNPHAGSGRKLAQVVPATPRDRNLPPGQPARGEATRGPLRRFGALILGFVALSLAGWCAGALWLSVVGFGELDGMRDLAADRSGTLTSVARIVTWAGSAFVLVPLGLACSAVLVRRAQVRAALVLVASLAGAIGLALTVKLLVGRPRPTVEHLQAVSGPSFPSGHATQASAFWFSLVWVLPAAGASPQLTRLAGGLALLIVLAVAASRVYLGVHYPSDVVAGMLLGTVWATYVSRCLREPQSASEGSQAR